MTILTTTTIITTIGVVLAALLTLAERYLLNYGICQILINGDKTYEVKGGNHLLGSLQEKDIFIPSACGGRGSCGLCKVDVLSGGGPLLPTETPYLTPDEISQQVRLSCQVRVREDIEIRIPEELFSIREYHTEVIGIKDLTYDIKYITLKLDEDETMDFVAGQYIQLRIPTYGKVKDEVYRAYSIASSQTNKDQIDLIIRRVPNGISTTYIFDYLKEADSILLNGPYGDFYLRDNEREIIFIAGGSGLGPIKSMLHKMIDEGIDRKSTFFFGCVSKKDLYYLDEMKEFEDKLPNFKFVPALSSPKPEDEWSLDTGLITEVVDKYTVQQGKYEAYLCGSPGMIDASIKVLRDKGIPSEHIFYDKF
ncbi:MAG TPA: 2Fe-2S iron-sulfur cluster binding domain-containing protein [Clostridia bacterium]|nr:2Fe-2S iron-sulfur cluster binding domain-containing protein [Clostridia bacterium]